MSQHQRIYKPPTRPSDDLFDDSAITTVFLAGSIEMGKAIDWQAMVAQHFKNHDNIVLLNPRRDDWDSSWSQTIDNPQFHEQVTWELSMLERCDAIFMYLAPETKSPISLLELGLHAASKKMVVCCPKGFWRKGNVDIVCQRYGTPCVDKFDDALELLHEFMK